MELWYAIQVSVCIFAAPRLWTLRHAALDGNSSSVNAFTVSDCGILTSARLKIVYESLCVTNLHYYITLLFTYYPSKGKTSSVDVQDGRCSRDRM